MTFPYTALHMYHTNHVLDPCIYKQLRPTVSVVGWVEYPIIHFVAMTSGLKSFASSLSLTISYYHTSW